MYTTLFNIIYYATNMYNFNNKLKMNEWYTVSEDSS